MAKHKNTSTYLLRRVLLAIYEKPEINIAFVAKKVDVTYSHLSCLVIKLEEQNILTFRWVGRDKRMSLTKKGEKLMYLLIQVDTLYKGLL